VIKIRWVNAWFFAICFAFISPDYLLIVACRAQIIVFDPQVPLIKGQRVMVHYLQCQRPATIHRLVTQLSKTSGEVVRKKPRALGTNSAGVIDIVFDRPACMDTYASSKDCGRLTLRMQGVTVAAGIVLRVQEQTVGEE